MHNSYIEKGEMEASDINFSSNPDPNFDEQNQRDNLFQKTGQSSAHKVETLDSLPNIMEKS